MHSMKQYGAVYAALYFKRTTYQSKNPHIHIHNIVSTFDDSLCLS